MIALIAEALRDARARRGSTTLAIATSAVAFAAILVIFGSSVSAGYEALAALESQDLRTIVVRFDASLEVSVDDLQAVQALEPVAEMLVLSPARDAWPVEVGSQRPIAVRSCLAGTEAVCSAMSQAGATAALASHSALQSVGFTGAKGTLSDSAHAVLVVEESQAPILTHGSVANTVIAAPVEAESNVALIVIEAVSSQHVATMTDAVARSLSAFDASKVSIESSSEIASMRELISSASFDSARFVTLAIFAGGAAVLVLSELTAARSRRRTMGLRRAVGASRYQIALGIVIQGGLTGSAGIALGGIFSLWILNGMDVAVPLVSAVAVAVVLQAVVFAASVVPAVYAARRDPARELRLP